MRFLLLRLLVLGFLFWPGLHAQNYPELTGYLRLLARLPGGVPTGTTVTVGLVEPPENGVGGHWPDTSSAEFTGINFDPRSGTSTSSVHSTDVAGLFFGRTLSFARGVQQVKLYQVDSDTGLLLSTATLDPANPAGPHDLGIQVLNNSWILNFDNPLATQTVRRLDWLADKYHVTIIGGLPNDPAIPIPALASSTYNSITVGLADASGSYGRTTFAETETSSTAGRTKPDLVVPVAVASAGTPIVSSAATVLVDYANLALRGGDTRFTYAARPEVIKAVLQAGALKFADWQRGGAGTADDLTSPLDLRYGAGQLDIDYAQQILSTGQQNPGEVARLGWTYETALTAGDTRLYSFAFAESGTWNLSASLNWHRQISNTGTVASVDTAVLPLLQLELFRMGASGNFELIDASRSTLDNLQHLYLPELAAGIYALRVLNTGTDTTPYALSWAALPALAATAIPEPGTYALWLGFCAGVGVLTSRRPAKTSTKT